MKSRGFTLVELVVTLIIVGVMAAAAIPRFFERRGFDARGFADQMAASLRYAQKAAIAQRRLVCVALSAPNTLALTIAATHAANTCTLALPLPASQANSLTAPNGVSFTTTQAALRFDGLGRPSSAAQIAVPIEAAHTITIVVEAETGYVH
jgi:MSHA pilin protein MshC